MDLPEDCIRIVFTYSIKQAPIMLASIQQTNKIYNQWGFNFIEDTIKTIKLYYFDDDECNKPVIYTIDSVLPEQPYSGQLTCNIPYSPISIEYNFWRTRCQLSIKMDTLDLLATGGYMKDLKYCHGSLKFKQLYHNIDILYQSTSKLWLDYTITVFKEMLAKNHYWEVPFESDW